jgi:RNA polymerase sigma factor (sigma-70 family)
MLPTIDHIDSETLYKEFFTPIFRYIFFRTRDYDVANDLTQTSFLKFLNHVDQKIKKDYAIKLLYVIAKNTLIDYWRIEKNRNNEKIEEIDEIRSADLNPEEIAIVEEDKKYITTILNELNETEKEIVTMRLSGDREYKMIADTLGISVVNTRKIYSRAIKKIRVAFNNNNL